MSEWISAKERVPENDRPVLAVKELKNGRRDITIARCLKEYRHFDAKTGQYVTGPYWVCGGCNNIVLWMELPEIPEGEE